MDAFEAVLRVVRLSYTRLVIPRRASARAAVSPTGPVVFVLINNDGGGIFHRLPIRAFEPAFTRYFATPHGLDFRHMARLYDLPHEEVPPSGVREALGRALQQGGVRILEVRTDRDENLRAQQTIESRVAASVEAALRFQQPRGS